MDNVALAVLRQEGSGENGELPKGRCYMWHATWCLSRKHSTGGSEGLTSKLNSAECSDDLASSNSSEGWGVNTTCNYHSAGSSDDRHPITNSARCSDD